MGRVFAIGLLTLFGCFSFGESNFTTAAQLGGCSCDASTAQPIQQLGDFVQSNNPMWIGFKRPSEIGGSIPWLGHVDNSIYEIVYPKGNMRVERISAATRSNNSWSEFQIESCRRQGISNCPIFSEEGDGTAWLIVNSSTIATAAHTIHDWVKEALIANPNVSPAQLQLPIRLFHNGVLVSGPTNAKLIQPNRKYWARDSGDTDKDFASEFVKINLNVKLSGSPLPIAKNYQLGANSEVYALGYPNATHVFSQLGADDAPGRVLVVSEGKLMSIAGYPQQNPSGERLQFTNANYFGGSGGPVFNSDGDVIGMTIAGESELNHGEVQTVTLAINFKWLLHHQPR